MQKDYFPGTITPEEERNGDGFKINHKGEDKWLIPLAGFVNKFSRWVASKKKFRVIIDYDPEWSMKVTFRRMTQAEAEEVDRCRLTKDELDKIHEGMPNYYDADKISRTTGNGARQEWFGVKEKGKSLVCAACDGTHKARRVLAIHGAGYKELIWRCECGNYLISVTYGEKGDN